ncbi:sugar phosphate isomerase/epimerase family protein [Tautonia plasticadhaerens]|uniref:Xylose isomerase-like TIM barrel n=1 Tax=Tautonia plasticadhaerens TaxID=2527974 RepID=A0A518GXA8_9BACT|nr:sugar phosphate isomerase/epimerase family protein [Tautonia plasticadhaerens]QDV33202.1 Xylose isomerase-like TIM barrel [Tautonia plasticadhaerens]
MIRSPLGLRLLPDPDRPVKDQLREAARLGARGVVLDASGDLNPSRLSDTGRRDLRHTLRSVELSLIALSLPTRRPFDTEDQLDDRLARASAAFTLAFELGAKLVLARVGAVPPEADAPRRAVFSHALSELSVRADHRGVRLAVETGSESGADLQSFLDAIDHPGLAASVDPGALLRLGHDPIEATRALGPHVAHAYARDATASAIDEGPVSAHPRGFGFAPGVLDWEEYLGALEEINYAGFLTIWPDPRRPIGPQFSALADRFARF